ncbi:helix-turn-helix domain-containing protein [Jannaschia aquimarina]|uniref:PuuR_2 protein n=1 Tax=Jannaschia aquimarina TaxID=935700 RepID=A0A0D1CQ92_9RHOB|nr:XRE family transcriptional regulator [Jannaschia aquimarina]KIT16927.1 HTH-type transcriptional regulator PuuR [Jannaschia aquimarina]SNT11431.1 transcriptional regulator, XRE family with cupin sensor [Jannaschia aquimarina]
MTDASEEPSLIRIARENGEEATPEPLDLGTRVRDLRKAQGWTLEQAAQRAGLARSTLSKIENGQMSPTFEAIRKLATGLGIGVPQLFTPPTKGQVTGRRAITRAGEGQTHLTTTYEHEMLAGAMTRKRMLPYRARIHARAFQEFDGWIRHDGEEFLLVLTGTIRLLTEFYEPVDMKRGDSAYYDASMGHNVISTSPEDATILWVTSLD